VTGGQLLPDSGRETKMHIAFAETDEEINACYDVMSQLRPHIKREDFLGRVRRQMNDFGYRLAFVGDDGEVVAVAGIRNSEWLHGGKSKGFGGQLFDWIVDLARTEGCDHVRLLSGVQRFDAHRFYLRKRMNIEAHYFTLDV
jgi:GNAT superfamily N-acetyltransferase